MNEKESQQPISIINGTYYVVQSFMVKRLQLRGLEKDLYAIIFGYCQNTNQCFSGSIKLLQDWTFATRMGISKALKSLIEKGYLYKETVKIPMTYGIVNRYYALAYADITYPAKVIVSGEFKKTQQHQQEGLYSSSLQTN